MEKETEERNCNIAIKAMGDRIKEKESREEIKDLIRDLIKNK